MVRKKTNKRKRGEEQVPLEEKTRDSVVVQVASQAKCKVPGLTQLLRAIVPEANKVCYFASILANGYVLHRLENAQAIPKLDS